jgi:hypothetical protein
MFRRFYSGSSHRTLSSEISAPGQSYLNNELFLLAHRSKPVTYSSYSHHHCITNYCVNMSLLLCNNYRLFLWFNDTIVRYIVNTSRGSEMSWDGGGNKKEGLRRPIPGPTLTLSCCRFWTSPCSSCSWCWCCCCSVYLCTIGPTLTLSCCRCWTSPCSSCSWCCCCSVRISSSSF